MDDLVKLLEERYADDERVAREASGGTVVGEPGDWRPSPAGDEWEAHASGDGDYEELLVALRPGLPRPPDVMAGYWGSVVSCEPDLADPGTASPMPAFRHAARHDPARVLREVAAKRELLALAAEADGIHYDRLNEVGADVPEVLIGERIRRCLAAVYGEPAATGTG